MSANVRVIFKGGHVEDFTFEEFTIERGPIDKGIRKVSWQSSPGMPRPMYFDLDEIACVIEVPPPKVSP